MSTMSHPHTQCPVCHSPVERTTLEDGAEHYRPSPLSPAILVLALDNEQVARGVSQLATPELRLALAGVLLEGYGSGAGYFTEQDVRDEAEAAARCDGVAAQLRKTGTRFAEAADFRDMAERHRTRATRVLGLLTEREQLRIKQQMHGGDLGGTPTIVTVTS
jgi:hypothetical protein